MNTALFPPAATDFSASANHAAERAAMLARQTDGQLALTHVLKKTRWTNCKKCLHPVVNVLRKVCASKRKTP